MADGVGTIRATHARDLAILREAPSQPITLRPTTHKEKTVIGEEILDKYEVYEDLYEHRWGDRRESRRTKPKYNTVSERMRDQILAEVTEEPADLELGFHPTYRPSRHEQGWLLSSLRSFYDQGLISDVVARVKGGKEANVYLCLGPAEKDSDAGAAGVLSVPRPEDRLLAAKVYRPRMFRNLRNDALYRQGREVMVAGGKAAGKQASTIARAIRNKTPYGMEAEHTSWLMHEYAALDTLYRAGAAVPRPLAANENAVLMSYCGEERMAAPTLASVKLELDEAHALYREVVRNVDLMLRHEIVHGDLSAYNILYWEGSIALIDFPQVVNAWTNAQARWILRRDLARTCEYFAAQGVQCQPRRLAEELWSRYMGKMDPQDQMADWSRWQTSNS